MANYPPPPPGGGFPAAAPPVDPYARERALAAWAQQRGYTLGAPDLNWYRAWYPCTYLHGISRVVQEIRLTVNEASIWIVESYEGDAIKEAAGEDRHVTCFVMSPRVVYRAAVRSKSGGGAVAELGHGIESLFGGGVPRGILGDPTFEARFDVAGPSREEANAALPMPLRQHLLQTNFRGIVEARPQGLIVSLFDFRGFDPQSLDGTIAVVGQIYRTITQYAAVVTAPPR